MRKLLFCLIAVACSITLNAQVNNYVKDLNGSWKFKKGDDLKWARPDLNTQDWNDITIPHWDWEGNYDGYGWFRKDFVIQRTEKEAYFFNLGQVDDNCEVYVNGKLVQLYVSENPGRIDADTTELGEWKKYRSYYIPRNLILPGKNNTIAIRIRDTGSEGGIRYGNIYLSNTVFYNQLPIKLAGDWLKTDGSNEWLVGFYNNRVAYKNKMWLYGDISTNANITTIKLLGDKNEQVVIKESDNPGDFMIGPDEAHLERCGTRQTYSNGFVSANETVGYIPSATGAGEATYNGYIKDYTPRHNDDNVAVLQFTGLNNKPVGERHVKINPDGTFSAVIYLQEPGIAVLHLPGMDDANCVYLEPGKATLQVIDPQEYKITFTSEYGNRERLTMFMGDNAVENKFLMYITWLYGIPGANEETWTKLQYTADRYARSGHAKDIWMNDVARCIAENYQKYNNDTTSLKTARYWSGKALLSSPENHLFNSTFNIVLQNLGERLEGLQYLVKALDIAEKDKNQEYIDLYKQQVKQYVGNMMK